MPSSRSSSCCSNCSGGQFHDLPWDAEVIDKAAPEEQGPPEAPVSPVSEADREDSVGPVETEFNIHSTSKASIYGSPVSAEEATALLPPGGGGLTWSATVVGEEWKVPDTVESNGEIRARRANLPVRASCFEQSLVQTEDGRWIFSGVLNGWPALNCLELIALEDAPPAKGKKVKRLWSSTDSTDGNAPPLPSGTDTVQAILQMPPWSAKGWSAASPGFVWWYFAQNPERTFAFGEDMLQHLKGLLRGGPPPAAVNAHIVAHRYAVGGRKEDSREKVTYHACVVLEWDHGRYCSVVELGPLNGISARYGRSNWVPDKTAEVTTLSGQMPACLVMPWKDEKAEIRVTDVEAKDFEEFKAFVRENSGHEKRFVDPQIQHSGAIRLTQRSQDDIMRYLLNYMHNEQLFNIHTRSCQTFAADFYSFLVGQAGIVPFHPSLRKTYTRHAEWFIYERKPAVEGAK